MNVFFIVKCGGIIAETCDDCVQTGTNDYGWCNMGCQKNKLGTKCVVKGKLACESK